MFESLFVHLIIRRAFSVVGVSLYPAVNLLALSMAWFLREGGRAEAPGSIAAILMWLITYILVNISILVVSQTKVLNSVYRKKRVQNHDGTSRSLIIKRNNYSHDCDFDFPPALPNLTPNFKIIGISWHFFKAFLLNPCLT